MSDEALQALERRLKEGDMTAWPILDAELARRGLPPRRIWMVNDVGGEYSDRFETVLEPVHATKEGAIAHAREFSTGGARRGKPLVQDPSDPEEWRSPGGRYEHERVYVSWSELVP